MTRTRPPVLLVVCCLVVLEAAALAGLGGAVAVELVRGRATMPGAAAFLAVCALGVGAVLALCARGLWNGRRWARSPVIMWQILLVLISIYVFDAQPTVASVVIVLAAAIAIGLLIPSVVRATTPPRESQPGS